MELVCTQDLTFSQIYKEFVQQHKTLALAYFAILLLIPIRDITASHLIGKILGGVRNRKLGQLRRLLLYGVVFLIVAALIYVADNLLEVQTGTTFEQFVKKKLLSSLFEMQRTNYKEMETGKILKRLTELPQTMFWFMDFWKGRILPAILLCLGIIVYFAFTHWGAALVATCIFLLYLFYIHYNLRVCSAMASKREAASAGILESMDDIMRNMMSVLSLQQQSSEQKRIERKHAAYKQHTVNSIHCTIKTAGLFFFACMLLLASLIGVYWVRNRGQTARSSPSSYAFVITTSILFFYLLTSIHGTIDGLKNIVLRWGNIQESLNVFQVCRPPTLAEDVGLPAPGAISFRRVSYAYVTAEGGRRQIFEDLNLDIPLGQKTLLLGHIGSGKSTLLTLLMRYQTPTQGDIFIDGAALSQMPVETLRQRMGYVPQTTTLFNRTLYENITYGLPGIDKARVQALFAELHLETMLAKLPQGLDTPCGKLGSALSGGQRQIVALMRLFLQNPEIVLLDEPTSAVDEATRDHVMHLLERLMRDQTKTVIMVTHDRRLVEHADRVVELEQGRVRSNERARA